MSNSLVTSVRSSGYLLLRVSPSVTAAVVIDGNELERVNGAKLLGLTISSNLTWNKHISDIIKKVSKRLYFLVQLKRSKVPWQNNYVHFLHCLFTLSSYIDSTHLFYALPKYLTNELVQVEKQGW